MRVSRFRSHRSLWLMAFDAGCISLAYVFFALPRYNVGLTQEIWFRIAVVACAAIVLQLVVGSLLRVYRGRTEVASLEETVLLAAITLGIGVVLSLANALSDPYLISRALPFGATFEALLLMLLGRALWRRHALQVRIARGTEAIPAIIFGAGSGGGQLVRSMRSTPSSTMRPVALLDDDPWKRHLRIDGVPVLGSRVDIATTAAKTGASVLVIAIPSANAEVIRDVSADARSIGLEVKILPGVEKLFSEHVTVRDVRDIKVDDLLGRGVIETDIGSIAGYLTGKRVLVTGAGGSIGSELCRQLHKWGPSELIMLDRDESALHAVQLSINGKARLDSPDVVLADIRDRAVLQAIFLDRRPDVVFHAAALKHLSMLEQYPTEAMKTNVLGTINVLKAAATCGVEHFVNISTDKAADPISVLGCSKRVAERITAAVASDTTGTYLSVRFGNVLGSRGSVLTSFAAQIASGGPVTVTHPEVTRYFMTVQEAVQLVIQAAAIGRDGEALVLDMGNPVLIEDVARQLIDQSNDDIEIVYTGLCEGEKMHEKLFGMYEIDQRPSHPLVSHVTVPEINLRHILEAPANSTHDEMTKQLHDWCLLGDLPPQERCERANKSDWSSIEN